MRSKPSKSSSRDFRRAQYEAERDYWSAIAKDGKTRVKFIIEGV
jgi:hypothetical protein